MAVTSGVGHSRVLEKRRFEDYKSLKQHYQNSNIEEIIISGSVTTNGPAAEICFVTGDVINYIGAEGQVYVRAEADDANQHSKYVYIEYQDDTGAVKTILTADLHAADSTTEVIVTGASDFYRLRRMHSEVESASGGGKMVLLTDSDWDGVADTYGAISDGQSHFALERFFTQPESTHKSYLAKVKLNVPEKDHDGAESGYIFSCTYTPKPVNLGEAQVAADVTETFNFSHDLDWQPCYELDGGTEVIFKVGDLDSAAVIHIEAVLVEVLL
jgi:hypothetical protein